MITTVNGRDVTRGLSIKVRFSPGHQARLWLGSQIMRIGAKVTGVDFEATFEVAHIGSEGPPAPSPDAALPVT